MVQSVEVLLDDTLDDAVRREWELLVRADLPSQGRHLGASNAPHVTLAAAPTLDAAAEERLRAVDVPAGLEVVLGGFLVFTGRGHVLSRAVVPSEALLRLHADVAAAVGDAADLPDSTRPGRWTPHVTLASRLDDAALAAAVSVLASAPRELVGGVREVRRWDSEQRATWTL